MTDHQAGGTAGDGPHPQPMDFLRHQVGRRQIATGRQSVPPAAPSHSDDLFLRETLREQRGAPDQRNIGGLFGRVNHSASVARSRSRPLDDGTTCGRLQPCGQIGLALE